MAFTTKLGNTVKPDYATMIDGVLWLSARGYCADHNINTDDEPALRSVRNALKKHGDAQKRMKTWSVPDGTVLVLSGGRKRGTTTRMFARVPNAQIGEFAAICADNGWDCVNATLRARNRTDVKNAAIADAIKTFADAETHNVDPHTGAVKPTA